MKRAILVGLFVLGLIVAGAAHAETIVSNLSNGPNGTHYLSNGGNLGLGQKFETGGAATWLGSVNLWLTYEGGGSLSAAIYHDLESSPPTTDDGYIPDISNKVVDLDVPTITSTGIWRFTPSDPTLLTANTEYWVVISIPDGQGLSYGWRFDDSDTPFYGTGVSHMENAQNWDGSGWGYLIPDYGNDESWSPYMMSVLTPVPGPASAALLLVGAFGLFIRRRKKAETK